MFLKGPSHTYCQDFPPRLALVDLNLIVMPLWWFVQVLQLDRQKSWTLEIGELDIQNSTIILAHVQWYWGSNHKLHMMAQSRWKSQSSRSWGFHAWFLFSKVQKDGAPQDSVQLSYKWLNSMVYGRYSELEFMGVLSWLTNKHNCGAPSCRHSFGPVFQLGFQADTSLAFLHVEILFVHLASTICDCLNINIYKYNISIPGWWFQSLWKILVSWD